MSDIFQHHNFVENITFIWTYYLLYLHLYLLGLFDLENGAILTEKQPSSAIKKGGPCEPIVTWDFFGSNPGVCWLHVLGRSAMFFFFFSVDFWQPKKGTFSALTGEICFLDVSFFIKAWVDCQYSNWKTQQSTYMLATSLAAGWNVLISLTCVLSCLVHCFFLPDSSKRIDNIAVTSLFLYLVIENPEQNTCGGFSENSGTPKSSIFIGFSIINHPFWGSPIFGNTHVKVRYQDGCLGIKATAIARKSSSRLPSNPFHIPMQTDGRRQSPNICHHFAFVIAPRLRHLWAVFCGTHVGWVLLRTEKIEILSILLGRFRISGSRY